jgi:hypothetical protein
MPNFGEGQVFRISNDSGRNTVKNIHPHFIALCNDETEEVLLLNWTTLKDGDFSAQHECILEPGDHPLITHTSYVRFSDADVFTYSQFENMMARDKDQFQSHGHGLTATALTRVKQVAKSSRFIARQYKLMFFD